MIHKPERIRPSHFQAVDLKQEFTRNVSLTHAVCEALRELFPDMHLHDGATLGDACAQIAAWTAIDNARIAEHVRAAYDRTCARISERAWCALKEELLSSRECQEIADGVHLANYRVATHSPISCIVNCTPHHFAYKPTQTVHTCVLYQDEYSPGTLSLALKQIDTWVGQGRPVLVHCIEGRFRSATVVAAWLMRYRGLSAAQSVDHVRRRRSWARPQQNVLERTQPV